MIYSWPFFTLTNLRFSYVKLEAKWEENEMKLQKEVPLKVAEHEIAADIFLLHYQFRIKNIICF